VTDTPLKRLVHAWTPTLGDWWAKERANHVAMVLGAWATLEAEGQGQGPSTLETCKSVLMSGRTCGLVFKDLEALARVGALAWDGTQCRACGTPTLDNDLIDFSGGGTEGPPDYGAPDVHWVKIENHHRSWKRKESVRAVYLTRECSTGGTVKLGEMR
jgi:hypothetical protein